jgi:hypothetical protein
MVSLLTTITRIAADTPTRRKEHTMKLLILPVLMCLVVTPPVVAETNDSIQSSDTNLIAACANKSDVVAHVKVLSMVFVRKPTDPTVVDLSVYGKLVTLDVKNSYLQKDAAVDFSTNIYLYRRGTLSVSFLEPILQVGQEYLVFLKRDETPEIVKSGVITDPALPTTNYFTFVHLPQRQTPKCKAYVKIADTNSLASVERCLSESVTPGQKAKGARRH